MPIEANTNSLLRVLEHLKETKKVEQNYKDNLKEIFYELFRLELCTITYDGEGEIVVKLHLSELTQNDIQKLNEIASRYTVKPCGSDVVSLQIFQFKGVEWYDRITGYVQQVGHSKSASSGWNAGKKQELIDRRRFEQ